MTVDVLGVFDRVADSRDAIPVLRRFLLRLAVRGGLVPHDPADEDAAVVLQRMSGAYQAQPATPPHLGDFGELRIPHHWAWTRVRDVGRVVGGGTPPSGDAESFAPPGKGIGWLTPADLGSQRSVTYISHGRRDITERGLSCSGATLMPAGTVLFSSRAPIGYVAIAATQLATNQGFKSVIPSQALVSEYLALYFKAFGPLIDSMAPGTTFREVSGKIVASLPFPLPPLGEQHRIVAKVDELMSLCDELEAAQAERESRRDRFRTTSLQNLVASDESKDSARFFLRNSHRMITKPEHVAGVRQAILDLAVRGMLVPQDSGDEPVTEFVDKGPIVAVHATAGPDGTPQPKGWSRVAIKRLASMVTSGSRDWAKYYSPTGAKFIRAQNIRFGHLLLNDLAHVTVPQKSEGIRTRVQVGDILIVITGAGVTNPGLLETDLGDAYVSQHVGLVRLSNKAIGPWVLLCLMAPAGARDELVARAYGSGKPGLNLDNIRSLLVPLPPLAEQHRIVAKVDELMAVCDELDHSLAAEQTERKRLLEALLHDALEDGCRRNGGDDGAHDI